ncbi:hypothetical protein NI17_009955 [Thermobifida halotolerans]|uniref:Uncharacterized protein n=2 Tax=Thermobifida halotolerans TaxID=483545 RepID=A0AA97LZW9_9ACTN|nr:hypothetical protein [Thermobifida halotolerans]UOE21402.1 hypothetical protein NI17_009955 [Thermobifida halotolerans]
MTPLAEFHTLTDASYRIVDLHDQDYGTDEDPLPLPGYREVVGGSLRRLYLQCVDDIVRVSVRLRLWEQDPGPGEAEEGEAWSEGESTELLCPSGVLLVDRWTMGPSAEWTLPVTGIFCVRVRHRGRDTARRRIDELREELYETEASPRERVTRLHTLDGTEQYLIDLWPKTSVTTKT